MVDDQTRLQFPSQGMTALALDATHSVVCCVASGPGGHPLHVLLDTGTDPSAMDARLARRLALRTGGSGVGQGAASDEVPFTEAVLPWLRLGDLLIRDLFAPALDLGALPFRVDVVLGYNVLRQMALRIEYRTRRLVLAHPDVGIAVSPRAVSLPLVFFEHFPALMNINVEGRHIPLATIDTGSNGALSVGPDVANALGLRPSAVDVTHARGAGFGGESAVLRRYCRQLQLGPFDLGDVEVDAHLGMGGDLRRAGRVNIGNRLLSRFAAVSIDYQRGTIAFDPDPIVDCRL